jgi:hypothetical protein
VIARVLLKIDEFVIDPGQQVAGLDQKILEQVFHSLKVAHINLLRVTSEQANAREARVMPKLKLLMTDS